MCKHRQYLLPCSKHLPNSVKYPSPLTFLLSGFPLLDCDSEVMGEKVREKKRERERFVRLEKEREGGSGLEGSLSQKKLKPLEDTI